MKKRDGTPKSSVARSYKGELCPMTRDIAGGSEYHDNRFGLRASKVPYLGDRSIGDPAQEPLTSILRGRVGEA